MAKTLRVGAYILDCDNSHDLPDLASLLGEVKKSAAQAHFLSEDCPIIPRTEKLTISTDYCLADFHRQRPIQIMRMVDLKGNEASKRFKPSEPKPSERTAFVIDGNALYVHEHENSGISASMIARYFRERGKCPTLTAQPAMHPDAMVRFNKQKRYTSLRIGLARIKDTAFLKERGLDNDAVLAVMTQFNSPSLKLEVALENNKGTLTHVFETVSALIGLPPKKQLTALEIWGSESEKKKDFAVDFIEGRVKHAMEVQLTEGGEIDDADRYRAVIDAWREHHKDLRKRYPSRNT